MAGVIIIDIAFPVDAIKYVRLFEVNQCKDYCWISETNLDNILRQISRQDFRQHACPFSRQFSYQEFPKRFLPGSPTKILVKISPGLCAAFFARKSAKFPARIKFILIFYRNVVWSLDSRWQRQWRMLRVPVQLSRHKVLYLYISRS